MTRIVADTRALEPGFVPDAIPHRRERCEVLAGALEPPRRAQRVPADRPGERAAPAAPVVLSGPAGAGKTCTARYAIRRLATREGVAVHHVDCWRTDGRFDLLRRLLAGADLPTHDLHRGSTPRSVLMDRLRAELPGRYVVVLDAVDRLGDADILYGLYRVPALTLVLVSRRAGELFESLDPRLRSRLRAGVRIAFDPYPEPALVEILRRRVDRALAPGVLADEQVRRVAAAAEGDAGRGVRVVRTAARLAREADADAIADDVLATAIRRGETAPPRRAVDDLPPDQRRLYDVVRETDGIAPAALYERYRAGAPDPKTRRTVRTYLAELVEDGLVRAEGETRQRRYVPVPRGDGA